MARYFDTLRDPTEAEANLESLNRADSPRLLEINQASDIRNLPVRKASNPAEEQALLRAGFRNNGKPGEFVSPVRDLTQELQQYELAKRDARQAVHDEQGNSTMFKIGDTLADTGRLFMSPLFWLSGEDSSKYDPSAVRKSGYRAQLEASVGYTSELYKKSIAHAEQRDAIREANNINDQTMLAKRRDQNSPVSPQGKLVFDYARLNGRMADFNSQDPTKIQQLTREARVNAGEGKYVGVDKRFMETQTYDDLAKIGTRFKGVSEDIGSAYMNYRQLVKALDAQTGIGDISAVFNYMKTLDPDSVVREGEFALARDAAGLFQRLSNTLVEAQTGKGLTDTARAEMRELAAQLIKTYEDKYASVRKREVAEIRYLSDNDEDVSNFLGEYKKLNLDQQKHSNTVIVKDPPPFGSGQGPLRQDLLDSTDQDERGLFEQDLSNYY